MVTERKIGITPYITLKRISNIDNDCKQFF